MTDKKAERLAWVKKRLSMERSTLTSFQERFADDPSRALENSQSAFVAAGRIAALEIVQRCLHKSDHSWESLVANWKRHLLADSGYDEFNSTSVPANFAKHCRSRGWGWILRGLEMDALVSIEDPPVLAVSPVRLHQTTAMRDVSEVQASYPAYNWTVTTLSGAAGYTLRGALDPPVVPHVEIEIERHREGYTGRVRSLALLRLAATNMTKLSDAVDSCLVVVAETS
jgi:hypothetical protein